MEAFICACRPILSGDFTTSSASPEQFLPLYNYVNDLHIQDMSVE